jgi:hypothetical protein
MNWLLLLWAAPGAIDWRCATMKAAAITMSTFSITHE